MSVNIIKRKYEQCDVLIVCDFPGNEEDFSETAFVGAEADLLRDLVTTAGLTRYNVAYTYAIRCKPPFGVKPTPKQTDACRDYLKEEIYARKPRAIVTMGDTALRACTKLSGIKDKRGKKLVLHGLYLDGVSDGVQHPAVFVTYSAAFVRRAGYAKATVISDLRRVGNFLEKSSGTSEQVCSWKWWDGEEITGDVLAYDIEAVDEEGNYTDYPTQISITGDNGTFVSTSVRELGALLVGRRTVGHNSWGYDVDVLNKYGIPVIKDHDTMALAYYMDEQQPLGLEALAVKYLGVSGWKEAFESKPGSDEFAYYNARDTYYTMQLFTLFRSALKSKNTLVEKLILPTRLALDAMSERGVYLDEDAIIQTQVETGATLHAAQEKIRVITKSDEFNPGSSVQVGEYLTKQGYELPRTDTGKPQTSESVLQSLASSDFVDALLEYRGAKKTLSTYVLPYLDLAGVGDGRAHTTYQLVRTRTGRTSSRNPNVQNLPRELKHFYSAPDGHVLLTVDYSAIEFRVAAWFAREKTILANFANDPTWDPHRYFASIFYGINQSAVTKYQRQVAKSANFSQLFLGNEQTLYEYAKKTGVNIPLQTCWDIHKAWHEAFPGFYSFYSRVREEILETGEVACPTGHVRHFGDTKLFDNVTFGNALREGVNVKVQNLAAHIAFLAMRRLHELNMPMVLFVHDSLSFELPNDYNLAATTAQICDIMTKYPINALREEFGVDFDLPLLVEAETRGKI